MLQKFLRGDFVDRLSEFEKILTAARDLGKNLQDDIDKLRAENEKLTVENQRLQSENGKLKTDSDNLLDEMETLENVVKDLRAANETFGVNLNKLMGQLNQAINDSHEKFMAQINSLMRDEFQKFLSEYMSKVKADVKTSTQNKKKSTNDSSETSVVKTSTPNITTHNEKNTALAHNVTTSKSKMLYADFYAEESVD